MDDPLNITKFDLSWNKLTRDILNSPQAAWLILIQGSFEALDLYLTKEN